MHTHERLNGNQNGNQNLPVGTEQTSINRARLRVAMTSASSAQDKASSRALWDDRIGRP